MNKQLHPILVHQLEKQGLGLQTPPTLREWQLLIQLISHQYEQLELSLEANKSRSPQPDSAALAKETFLTNMGHELRTPLASIINYSGVLEDMVANSDNDSFGYLIEKILGSAHYLLAVINDILDLSQLESDQVRLNRETFDVCSLLSDLTTKIRPAAAAQNTEVSLICRLKHPNMYSDQEKVSKIIMHLLSNAVKFTENGRIDITAVTQKDADGILWLQCEVTDTGIGISSTHLSKLFAPFTQVDDTTTRKYNGTGLGLTISKRYCQLLGGEISVDSKLHEGSTFTIRLPLFKRTGFLT